MADPHDPAIPEEPEHIRRTFEQGLAVAAADAAARNGLRAVPPDGKVKVEPRRALSSNSYYSLVFMLKDPSLRERILGTEKLELNELGMRVELGRKPVKDTTITRIRSDIEEKFPGNKDGTKGRKYSKADVRDAVHQIAEENRYHPVREYLQALKWDGQPRLEHVAEDLLGIQNPTPIARTILRKWFVAAVKRPMEPGCTSKAMLILLGDQNAAKSTWFQTLASKSWFNDNSIDIHSKEAHVILASVWIQEWAELRELQGRTAEAVKGFISSRVGKSLPKFSNFMEEFPRCSVIVGTTNQERFLDDPSGNVRYWPITVGPAINLDLTAAWRDQLWAEAMTIWAKHEPYDSWLTPAEEAELKDHQVPFEHQDPWAEAVALFVEDREEVSNAEIFDVALKIGLAQRSSRDSARLNNIMKKLGYSEKRLFGPLTIDGKRQRPHGWSRGSK